MALAMIRGAEAAGRLAPGQPVIEYTGGSTGTSLAFVCALTGHPLYIVTSTAFAPEKAATMAVFGAQVEALDSPEGITGDLITRMRARVAERADALGAYRTDQFENTDMVVGYHAMGAELLVQLPDGIDAWCSYVGTAGCFLGVAQVLRAAHPNLLRVVVEPEESAVITGGPPGTHRIEGGGVGFVPPQLNPGSYDRVVAVSTAEAVGEARRAARELGLFSGPSTGANLVAARRVANELGAGRVVGTVQVDSGLKYLAGGTYETDDAIEVVYA